MANPVNPGMQNPQDDPTRGGDAAGSTLPPDATETPQAGGGGSRNVYAAIKRSTNSSSPTERKLDWPSPGSGFVLEKTRTPPKFDCRGKADFIDTFRQLRSFMTKREFKLMLEFGRGAGFEPSARAHNGQSPLHNFLQSANYVPPEMNRTPGGPIHGVTTDWLYQWMCEADFGRCSFSGRSVFYRLGCYFIFALCVDATDSQLIVDPGFLVAGSGLSLAVHAAIVEAPSRRTVSVSPDDLVADFEANELIKRLSLRDLTKRVLQTLYERELGLQKKGLAAETRKQLSGSDLSFGPNGPTLRAGVAVDAEAQSSIAQTINSLMASGSPAGSSGSQLADPNSLSPPMGQSPLRQVKAEKLSIPLQARLIQDLMSALVTNLGSGVGGFSHDLALAAQHIWWARIGQAPPACWRHTDYREILTKLVESADLRAFALLTFEGKNPSDYPISNNYQSVLTALKKVENALTIGIAESGTIVRVTAQSFLSRIRVVLHRSPTTGAPCAAEIGTVLDAAPPVLFTTQTSRESSFFTAQPTTWQSISDSLALSVSAALSPQSPVDLTVMSDFSDRAILPVFVDLSAYELLLQTVLSVPNVLAKGDGGTHIALLQPDVAMTSLEQLPAQIDLEAAFGVHARSVDANPNSDDAATISRRTSMLDPFAALLLHAPAHRTAVETIPDEPLIERGMLDGSTWLATEGGGVARAVHRVRNFKIIYGGETYSFILSLAQSFNQVLPDDPLYVVTTGSFARQRERAVRRWLRVADLLRSAPGLDTLTTFRIKNLIKPFYLNRLMLRKVIDFLIGLRGGSVQMSDGFRQDVFAITMLLMRELCRAFGLIRAGSLTPLFDIAGDMPKMVSSVDEEFRLAVRDAAGTAMY